LLDDQQRFFKALRSRVQMLVRARKTPQEVLDSVAEIRATLAGDKKVARFVQDSPFNFFPGQVEKVYTELTGRRFPVSQNSGWGPRPGNFREKDVTSSSSDLGRDLPLAAHLRS
jgi:hypothetical protein